jgi:hypothetical protein
MVDLAFLIEVFLAIIAVAAIFRIARADGQSGLLWGTITVLLEYLCFRYLRFSFARVLIACVLAYAAMTAYKIARARSAD